MKKIIGVRISDMDDEGYTYIAHSKKECKDFIDEGVYGLVTDTKDVITMGHVFGEPIWGNT